jgi:hypothetical protein
MLAQAFARSLDDLESPALTERVLEGVKREQRLRMLVTVLVTGLALVLAPLLLGPVIAPVLADLTGALALPDVTVPAAHTILAVAVAFVLAPWLYALVEDPL